MVIIDSILYQLFNPERWERAISSGVVKGISKTQLRQMCSPETRLAIYKAIRAGEFEIAPPHEARIPKENGDFRTVYVNEPFDRIFLSVVNDILFDMYPEMIHRTCTSYQKGIGTGKVVNRLVEEAKSVEGKLGWKADLSKYFDSVPIRFIDAVFDRLGDDPVIDVLRKYYHSDLCFDIDGNLINHYASLKQGCAVAAFLADVMLYETDDKLSKLNGYYVRYSDDMIFIGEDADKAMEILKADLAKMQMKLNPKKVEDLYADRWFKFLGYNIKGDMITLSKSRVKKFQKEIEDRTIKGKRSFRSALNSVNNFLYVGDGEYSWATNILGVINVEEDINELNNFVMDALRAMMTGKKEIGGLGSANNLPNKTVLRGTGKNVKANRQKTPKEIKGYMSLTEARNALVTDRAVYNTLVRML